MSDPSPRAPSLVSVLAADPTVAADLDRLAEELAFPFIVYFQHGLAAGTFTREDLPVLIESACQELAEFFLRQEHVRRFEVTDLAALKEYTELVVDRVRKRFWAVME